jgi:SP family general alpha glucoside:H+ symporter-like MFS transporter
MSTEIQYGKSETQHLEGDEKGQVEHVEHLGLGEDAVAKTIDGQGLLKSRFDEMSIPRTLWVFRRVVLVTLAVYTGYMCEGFEVSESL